jgi:hypothetical protein
MAAQQVLDKFSLDTPFGVALWPIFDKVYTAATGKSANSFAFIEGVTPLSTQREGNFTYQRVTWLKNMQIDLIAAI